MQQTRRHSLMRTLYHSTVIAGIVSPLLFWTQVTGAHRDTLTGTSNVGTAEVSLAEITARKLASNHPLVNFDVSLAVKEDADFLLTPALLVQEALREDVVVTYPTE